MTRPTSLGQTSPSTAELGPFLNSAGDSLLCNQLNIKDGNIDLKVPQKSLYPNCADKHHIGRGDLMSATSVQFTVGAHIMAALGFRHGEELPSAMLAESVNANPTFVRKSLSKLSKAGLVVATRGKNGASRLTRSPKQITLLDVYRASEAPPTFAIHSYPVEKRCPISCNIKGCMSSVLKKAQESFENSLAGITLADVVGEIRRASQ